MRKYYKHTFVVWTLGPMEEMSAADLLVSLENGEGDVYLAHTDTEHAMAPSEVVNYFDLDGGDE